LLKIPVIIHESNLIPGTVTKYFGFLCKFVLIGFKDTNSYLKNCKTIFTGGIEFEYALLSSRLRELAYLNGGVKIVFRDERNQFSDGSFKEEIYLYQGGIKEYVEYMNAEKDSIHPEIIYVDSQKKMYM